MKDVGIDQLKKVFRGNLTELTERIRSNDIESYLENEKLKD